MNIKMIYEYINLDLWDAAVVMWDVVADIQSNYDDSMGLLLSSTSKYFFVIRVFRQKMSQHMPYCFTPYISYHRSLTHYDCVTFFSMVRSIKWVLNNKAAWFKSCLSCLLSIIITLHILVYASFALWISHSYFFFLIFLLLYVYCYNAAIYFRASEKQFQNNAGWLYTDAADKLYLVC